MLYTSITLTYEGRSQEINNIVIDTGAAHTLLSSDCVDDIGIRVSHEDEIVVSYGIGGKEHSFTKEVDHVQVGTVVSDRCTLDFTSFQYENINGLLGLDLLMNAGFVINLKEMKMYRQE